MGFTTVTSSQKAVANLSGLRAASSSELARAEMKRLKQAAEVIAVAARAISGRFSKRIPESIKVVSTGKAIWVVADGSVAPNANPFETGGYHPVFAQGPRENWTWRKQPKRPFMEEAAAAKADEALEAFSEVIDDWVKQLKL